jgi:hypothetical protein
MNAIDIKGKALVTKLEVRNGMIQKIEGNTATQEGVR